MKSIVAAILVCLGINATAQNLLTPKVPFTDTMSRICSAQTIKNLQFWTSSEVVLIKNNQPTEGVATKNHNLKVVDKRITIPANTPCRVVEIRDSVVYYDTTYIGNSMSIEEKKILGRYFVAKVEDEKPFPLIPFKTVEGGGENGFAIYFYDKGRFYSAKDFYSIDQNQSNGNTFLQIRKKDAEEILKAGGSGF